MRANITRTTTRGAFCKYGARMQLDLIVEGGNFLVYDQGRGLFNLEESVEIVCEKCYHDQRHFDVTGEW